MILRHPSAAGQYYPRDRVSLEQTLTALTRRVRTPKRTVLGALVPHSGVTYCGETQAYAYKSFAGSPIFVIIGANHARLGAPYAIMTQGTWATPLGNVGIDSELAKAIASKAPILANDIQAFTQEHSIETQLPWLQHLFRDVAFVPISIYGDDATAYRTIGVAIRAAAKETGRSIAVIASSDLTRYGASFAFAPVEGDAALDWIKETDQAVLEAIAKMDVETLLNAAERTNLCGLGAIATMLYACMEVSTGGTLLQYATSFPITRTTSAVTSYAAVVME
ncbi:MAG: AmmeMemoRadiSam system protein B [Candidatus Aenigmatarchaeota archaeon]|nr:MAG: AmmeMemoRadiSam system protein B [Candidatus Aenigmarchaeota archaeon]